MSLHEIQPAGAFSPGADLWVVPDGSSSPWTMRIDWYLNFQIARMRRRQPLHISEDVDQALRLNGIDLIPPEVDDRSPTFIVVQDSLPCFLLVELPVDKAHPDRWLDRAWDLARKFANHPIRLFVPEGIDPRSRQPADLTAAQTAIGLVVSAPSIDPGTVTDV
jgi:hypothetical protein